LKGVAQLLLLFLFRIMKYVLAKSQLSRSENTRNSEINVTRKTSEVSNLKARNQIKANSEKQFRLILIFGF